MASEFLLGAAKRCADGFIISVAMSARQLFYAGVVAILLAWLVATRLIKCNKSIVSRETSPDLEKPTSKKGNILKGPERPPGVWTPVVFKRPEVTPYPAWDVHKTDPLPYRPFKHGPYHVTMGLRNMQWDDWIELDNHYLKFHAEKARRIEEKGLVCCRTAPEAYDGAVELLEELLECRFPSVMDLTTDFALQAATTSPKNTLPFIARLLSAWTTSPRAKLSTLLNALFQKTP